MDSTETAYFNSQRRGTPFSGHELLTYTSDDGAEEATAASSTTSTPPLHKGTFQATGLSHLHSLPKDLYQRQRDLTIIDISSSSISLIKNIFSLHKLTVFKITHSKLNELPDGFEHLSFLKIIDVSFNPLKNLPKLIGEAPILKEVHATNCLLRGPLPESLLHCKTLKVLAVQNNDLFPQDFPSTASSLVALKRLIVDEQTTIDGASPFPLRKKTFLKAKGICIIHPRENYVTTLVRQSQTSSFDLAIQKSDTEVEFAQTTQVHSRFLSEDDQSTTEDVTSQKTTEISIASSEHLADLPITSLSKISELSVQNDPKIIYSSPRIQHLSNMRTLVLTSCKIDRMKDDFFTGLLSLEHLDLSENNLRVLPRSFIDSSLLKICILNDNNITIFPEIPRNLVSLYINRNQLCIDNDPENPTNFISVKQFAYARSLTTLEMSDNCILPKDFFPDHVGYPSQLLFKIFKIDARAVPFSGGSYKETLHMQEGCQAEYITEPSQSWQRRVRGDLGFRSRTSIIKAKLGESP